MEKFDKNLYLDETPDEYYDYYAAVHNDIIDAIPDEDMVKGQWDPDEFEQHLHYLIDDSDAVTGNASGSYFCNRFAAEGALAHNLDLLNEAVEEFGYDGDKVKELLDDPEAADVIVRCYLLDPMVKKVVEEFEEDGFFEEDDEEVED